jgi:hypothetical protein
MLKIITSFFFSPKCILIKLSRTTWTSISLALWRALLAERGSESPGKMMGNLQGNYCKWSRPSASQ